jgi:hypothetical protein
MKATNVTCLAVFSASETCKRATGPVQMLGRMLNEGRIEDKLRVTRVLINKAN